MRKLLLFAAALTPLTVTGCDKVVAPGNVGIVVKQAGTDRGVQDFPIQSGRVWYNPINEVVLTYPTYVQRAVWTSSVLEGKPFNDEISFPSAEGCASRRT